MCATVIPARFAGVGEFLKTLGWFANHPMLFPVSISASNQSFFLEE
jgi:hypothetical protein